jgi:hypothetical protein
MKQVILFLLITLSTFCFAQMPDIVVELNTDSSFTNYGFSCLKVLDERDSKDNIGYVSRGIGRNNSKLILQGDSTEFLIQTIKDLLPKEANKPELVLIIRNIIASENIGTQNQYGFCNTEIEFARQEDTSLYSLGTFYSSISEKSNKIKYTHGNRVLLALEKCFRKFNNSNWKSKDGELIDYTNNDTIFNYKEIPPKGAYYNYKELKRQAPFNSQDYQITLATKSKNHTKYKINFMESINPKFVKFVSDGKELYVRANQTHFIKSGSYGKYIYFQGRIQTVFGNPNYIKSITNTLVILRDLKMRPVENLFFTALISDPDSYGEIRIQNNKVIGVVIDTETGKVKLITDIYLYKITKKFPLMLKEYRKSKRRPDDKRKVIEALNSKF